MREEGKERKVCMCVKKRGGRKKRAGLSRILSIYIPFCSRLFPLLLPLPPPLLLLLFVIVIVVVVVEVVAVSTHPHHAHTHARTHACLIDTVDTSHEDRYLFFPLSQSLSLSFLLLLLT